MRSKKPNKCGAGQQCCYDANGKLITNGPGAGSADKVSIVVLNFGPGGHQGVDVDPAKLAQMLDEMYFDGGFYYQSLYLWVRPTNNGKKCPDNPPIVWDEALIEWVEWWSDLIEEYQLGGAEFGARSAQGRIDRKGARVTNPKLGCSTARTYTGFGAR